MERMRFGRSVDGGGFEALMGAENDGPAWIEERRRLER